MEKIYLSAYEYDAAVEKYYEQHGYDNMSDEEKEEFDNRLDQVVAKKDADSYDEPETMGSANTKGELSDSEKLRAELKSQYGYDDMPGEQKRAFDEKLDEVVCSENDEGAGENEVGAKGLRRTR